VAADPGHATDEQGISMRTIRTTLIVSGLLAHVAMAHATTTNPDTATSAARSGTQAAVQPADAGPGAVAAADRQKRTDARSRASSMWTSKADLRYCLDRGSNDAIIRCAEGMD